MKPLYLSTDCRITRVPHNYVVEYAKTAKTGKSANTTVWKQTRFFGTLEQAAQYALQRQVGDIDAEGCTALIEAIHALESAVSAMCRRFENAA